jgi:hypothetical protein
MLLYLVKHLRPDMANVVRELSKMMDGATPAAFKELKRVIEFVLDTRTFGLKIKSKLGDKEKWSVTIYTDSEYAGETPKQGSALADSLSFYSLSQFYGKQKHSIRLHSLQRKQILLHCWRQQKKSNLWYKFLRVWGLLLKSLSS